MLLTKQPNVILRKAKILSHLGHHLFPFVGARPSTLEPADILGAVRHRGVRGALRWTTGLFSFPGRCAGTLIRGIYEIWRSRGFE